MGGTGIRCLFDSTKKQRSTDTNRFKKKNAKEEKQCIVVEVCEKEETNSVKSIDQQEEDEVVVKCECQRSVEIVACCKPGCSIRMPCLACTRSGCKAVIPCKVLRKKECTCGKSKCDEKIKSRSRSEGRTRAKSARREKSECCDLKSKKKVCDQPKKVCKEEDLCDEMKPEEICETLDESMICCPILIEATKPKSPCRKLKSCPCDSCKNVSFNDKCEVIPSCSFSSDQGEDSCSDDNSKICSKPEISVTKQKRKTCTPKNTCGLSDCPKTFCIPTKTEPETNCQCNDCKPQMPNKNRSRRKSEPCEFQAMSELSSMLPPTYVMQNNLAPRMGNMNWPREISCPCGPCEIPNYSNSLYQNSYPSSPFHRQY